MLWHHTPKSRHFSPQKLSRVTRGGCGEPLGRPAVADSKVPLSAVRQPPAHKALDFLRRGWVLLPRPAQAGERLGRPRPRGGRGARAALGRRCCPGLPLPGGAAPTVRGRGAGAERSSGGAASHGPAQRDAPRAGRVSRADYTSRRAPRAAAAQGMPGAQQHRGLHDLPRPPARQRPLVSRRAGLSRSRPSERRPHHPISAGCTAAVANHRRGGAGPRRGRR